MTLRITLRIVYTFHTHIFFWLRDSWLLIHSINLWREIYFIFFFYFSPHVSLFLWDWVRRLLKFERPINLKRHKRNHTNLFVGRCLERLMKEENINHFLFYGQGSRVCVNWLVYIYWDKRCLIMKCLYDFGLKSKTFL